MAVRLRGHKLTMEWSGEYGIESSSTGTCPCGWTESGSSQKVVRFEYRQHLRRLRRDLGLEIQCFDCGDQYDPEHGGTCDYCCATCKKRRSASDFP